MKDLQFTIFNVHAPPIYMFHADGDKIVNPNQSKMMAEALEGVGAPHKLEIIEGMGHYFPFKSEKNRKVVREVMDFVMENARPSAP